MAAPSVIEYLSRVAPQIVPRIQQFTESGATVMQAAECFHCRPEHIAKAISCLVKTTSVSRAENNARQRGQLESDGAAASASAGRQGPQPVVIVVAGDAKLNNQKYKAQFSCASKMIKREELEDTIGLAAGGVCPFGLKDNVLVYLDVSLKRYKMVYPACGYPTGGVGVTVAEMEQYAQNFAGWIDVCDGWQETSLEGDDNAVSNKEEAAEGELV